jgi:hypothetical protein
MGLQVRLTHSLGERLIDLQERGVDRPIVVGRSSTAEVQIPSTTVAKRHCMLFLHEGRWAVQDAGSPSGTFLNGKPVKEPAPVRTGDVITIGAEAGAPSITIDPYGLGIAGEIDEESTPPPFSRDPKGSAPAAHESPAVESQPAPVSPPPAAGARYSVPRAPAVGPVAYAPPRAAPPQYVAPTYAPQANEEPQDDWTSAEWADVPRDSSYYVPKPKRVSPAVMVWTVLFCLAVLGGVIWAVRNAQQRQRQNMAKAPVVIEEEDPTTRRVAPTAPSTTTRPAAPTAAAPPQMTEPEPPDPRREEESWQAVERTRLEDPVIAIVKFNDYLELQPDTPFRKDVDKYVDEALDRLWWARVVELFGEIDEAKKEIARRQEELKLAKDEQFKKNLEEEIRQLSEKRELAERRLRTEMKFTAAEPPNLHDSQRLAHFRSQRPDAYYQKWKTEVYDLIRRSKGQRLPWKEVR